MIQAQVIKKYIPLKKNYKSFLKMTILLIIFYFGIFSFLLTKWKWVKNSEIKNNILITLLAIKVFAGFALVYLYGHLYDSSQSDIYIYYNDAIYLKHLFLNHRDTFWNIIFNRNINLEIAPEVAKNLNYWYSPKVDILIHEKKIIILLNFLFSFISFSQIYIHSLFMAFIGFIGQIAIFRFVKKESDINPLIILSLSFLLPTFLLWSSSILKEPLIILTVGFLLFFVGKWTRKWKLKYIIGTIIFFFLGLLIKPYVVLSLVFPILLFIFFKYKPYLTFKKQSLTVVSSITIFLLLVWALSFSNFNVLKKLSDKQDAFYKTITLAEQTQKVGSKLKIEILEPTIGSVLLNTPKAFSNVLFKPSVFDFKNLLYLPDIFQNILLLLIGISILWKYKIPEHHEFPFLWFSILFVFILYTTIGLVTPVLGAIVRYKIPALPFVYFVLLSFLRIKPLNTKLASIFFHNN